MDHIPRYNTDAVRDLAHACFGHNLLNQFDGLGNTFNDKPSNAEIRSPDIALTEERLAWLQYLDRRPNSLHAHLDALKTRRLGMYFEALWQFFIQHDSQLELIAHNVAVVDGGRTLGEFDILYRDIHSNEGAHLELAVKFFLNQQLDSNASPALDQWLGPNTNDRLDKKQHRNPLRLHLLILLFLLK